jgi:hypothetical protein
VRIIFDTNIWVSSLLLPKGIPGQIVKAWQQGSFQVIRNVYKITWTFHQQIKCYRIIFLNQLKQYCLLFLAIYEEIMYLSMKNVQVILCKILSVLKIEDAKKAIAPFCRNLAEMEKIIEKIGFNNISKKINIRAKCEYDQIYNSDFQSSSEIAERIFKELL